MSTENDIRSQLSLIDITGPIFPGMWDYGAPYFTPKVWSLDFQAWEGGPIYAEAVSMPLQSGTYLETAAHVFPTRERLGQLPIERTVLVPSICIYNAVGPRSALTAAMIEPLVRQVADPPYKGKALLIGTGWSSHWRDADFLTECPYLSEDAIDFVLEHDFAILGGDTPRYDNPYSPTGHLFRFFESETLLLAPLYNLEAVGNQAGWLIAAPLHISDISASPVRAVWLGNLGPLAPGPQ
jgi:kynurenine formamidase